MLASEVASLWFVFIVTLSIVNAYNVQLARQMISVSNLAKVITIGTIIACGIYNISSGEITNILRILSSSLIRIYRKIYCLQ